MGKAHWREINEASNRIEWPTSLYPGCLVLRRRIGEQPPDRVIVTLTSKTCCSCLEILRRQASTRTRTVLRVFQMSLLAKMKTLAVLKCRI